MYIVQVVNPKTIHALNPLEFWKKEQGPGILHEYPYRLFSIFHITLSDENRQPADILT